MSTKRIVMNFMLICIVNYNGKKVIFRVSVILQRKIQMRIHRLNNGLTALQQE